MDAYPAELPSVSVIIPFYNRGYFLERCVAPLLHQTYPSARFELILVDDGSTDDWSARIDDLARDTEVRLRVIRQPNGGPASARNTGLRDSQADLIAFIDSDCVAAEDWLRELVDALLKSQADGLGAPMVEPAAQTWVGDYLSSTQFFRHRIHGQIVDYLLTSNAVFKRQALCAVKGFRVHEGAWSEDADLSFRLIQAGFRLAVTDRASVTHYGSPASVRSFARLLFRYGRGNCLLSTEWHNGRTPWFELTRHLGAVILSPFLVLRHARRLSLPKALKFWPLIILEHSAFIAGLVSGLRVCARSPSGTGYDHAPIG